MSSKGTITSDPRSGASNTTVQVQNYGENDVIGIELDMFKHSLKVYKNNVEQGQFDVSSNVTYCVFVQSLAAGNQIELSGL